MANRAAPKKRTGRKPKGAAAADTNVVDMPKTAGQKAAETRKARQAETANGTAGAPRETAGPSNVADETYQHHWAKYAAKRAELAKVMEEAATIRGELGDIKKKAKGDGCNIDAMVDVYKLLKQDQSDARTHFRDVRRILSIVKPETAKQLDMFLDTRLVDVVDPDAAGFQSASNGEPADNNPHRPGTEDAVKWDEGHRRGVAQLTEKYTPPAPMFDDTTKH